MCPWLVELVFFAEVKDNRFGLFEAEFEVDKVEHKVADCVEDYVLSECFRNPHGLLSFLSIGLTSPVLKRLSEIIRDISSTPCERLFIFLHFVIFLPLQLFLGFFCDSFLEFLVDYFLQAWFPNVFFLPNSVVVDKLGKIEFLENESILNFEVVLEV